MTSPDPRTAAGQHELFARSVAADESVADGTDPYLPSIRERTASIAALDASYAADRQALIVSRRAVMLAAQVEGGFSVGSLARHLGLSVKTVRTTLTRARQDAGIFLSPPGTDLNVAAALAAHGDHGATDPEVEF